MKKWQLISLLIFVYIIGLVVLFPARMVAAVAPLPSTIQLGQISGSIWNGSVERVVVSGGSDGDISLYDVEWRLSPWALLTLSAEVDVNIPAQQRNILQGSLTLNASNNALSIRDARFAGDLEDLMLFSPIQTPIPIRGGLSLHVQEFILGQPLCSVMSGNAVGVQVNAQLGNQWQNLGDYETQLGCTEGRLGIDMPHNNMLGLSITGWVSPSGVDLRIGVAPTAEAPQGIRDLIEWLGEPDSQGRRYFNFRL
ncbi:MAG: type II secretion system protein N [Idiomarina sp.]|nr:type II secretion system protein N [Idiomarina sp.]